ncbi:MAG TPA: tetratricopeptide repeat protein [Candidatus Polarisedimenticolia bacterium]|jgi:tetratricopeptide (TPR) repeat protein|nr:tetratricopeptide repeat protein [Candidatus Polarisedimenticolia bacterium]
MRRSRAAALILAILAASLLAQAQEGVGAPEVLFDEGNAAYARGDFSTAEKAYLKILDGGLRNSRVYYNLANACFRQNQIGRAILFYEKAVRLDPADPDARENLHYASQRIRDRIAEDPAPLAIALLQRGLRVIGLEQTTRIFLALYLSAMLAAAIGIAGWRKRWARTAGILAASLFFLALLAGGWMVLQERARNAQDEAIVLVEKLEVYSGPGDENTLLASLHEGTKVRIHSQRGDWTQVTIPDGRAGWLKGKDLGVI